MTSRKSSASATDDGKPVTIEGMPIGLFENELTVQLWKPVTIRGYTFSVGDNLTLDQTRRSRRPLRSEAISPSCSRPIRPSGPGTPIDTFWNRLPPPLASRGKQGADPVADLVPARSAHDSAGGPVADAAVPLRQGRQVAFDGNRHAGQLLRRAGPGPVPVSVDSRAEPELSRRAEQGSSRLPGRRLDHDDEQGVALPSVPRDRPVQAQRRRRGRQRPRPARGRHEVPARVPRSVDRQPAPDAAVHGHAPEHRTARATSRSRCPRRSRTSRSIWCGRCATRY